MMLEDLFRKEIVMESLESLRQTQKMLEKELDSLTVKKEESHKWGAGIQDQFDSSSYTYEEYLDPARAYAIKEELVRVKHQIQTYAQRATEERNVIEHNRERSIPKYEYSVSGEQRETQNPAMAARYNTRDRFYGRTKLQQTMAKVTGQKRKFETLWRKAAAAESLEEQQKIANQLNGMFR